MSALAASRCSSAFLKMTSASAYSSEPTVIGDVGHVVVVESVDVVHDVDGGQDEQVNMSLAMMSAATCGAQPSGSSRAGGILEDIEQEGRACCMKTSAVLHEDVGDHLEFERGPGTQRGGNRA